MSQLYNAVGGNDLDKVKGYAKLEAGLRRVIFPNELSGTRGANTFGADENEGFGNSSMESWQNTGEEEWTCYADWEVYESEEEGFKAMEVTDEGDYCPVYWNDDEGGYQQYDEINAVFLARDQCRICKGYGHWGNECPMNKGGAPVGGKPSPAKGVVDYGKGIVNYGKSKGKGGWRGKAKAKAKQKQKDGRRVVLPHT